MGVGVLALYVAFWLELDNPFWAGTSAAIVCRRTRRVASQGLVPDDRHTRRRGHERRVGRLLSAGPHSVSGRLALWCAGCSFLSVLLRNFASYSAMLAGYTVAIIAGDLLGVTGGSTPTAFLLAVTRASEICIGIVSAGVVLAGTDLGGAARRLAGCLRI